MHRLFVLEPVTQKRAAPNPSLSVGAEAGENQMIECPRRKSCQEVFGQGFDSPRIHHKSTVILIELRWTFSMPENRLKSDFSAVSAHKRPRCRAILRRGSFMLKNGKSLDFKRFSGIEKAHRNSIKITVDLWRSGWDSNPF